ncbi:MAG: hypothetical protein F9K21_06220 [Rhodocyclaceae bacterium]|nr:MAG: hypothetical protein F9K21_06220 [Rhodocyclaceae bacterium]CAG0931471.1 hypothetical protein RHDC3_01857 [Rhodocyclaceae bacterium]
MPQQRLLYLDGSHLSASLWQGGVLREEGHFPQNESGAAAFAEYLSQHRGSNFSMLADIADEGFQIETLPYTQGADRNALLARKLGQYFYGSPLATAVSYGREKSGRKDERFMLTALTRPQLFEPWLAALRAAEVQLAGIWSLPLLGGALLDKLQAGKKRCLLVSITRGGIRQSFYEDGQLKFSRLSPAAAAGAAEMAASCAAEVAKIHQYLLGQRLVARGAPLPVIALVHPAQSGIFLEQCKNSEELQITLQDQHAVCRLLKLKTLPQDSRSESLYLHLLAQNPPREQFAPPPERRFYRLWQTRNWLLKGGALVLLGCLLFAGRELVNALEARSATEALLQQAEADMQRYQSIQKTFPPMPASTDSLRAVINRFEDLEKRTAPIEATYLAVSRALGEVPKADIERIQWQLSANPDEGLLFQADARKPAPAASGNAMHATAVVHGLLPASMAADQRGQLETVNAFADALRRDAGLRVTIQRMPFDIESGKSLKSSSETEQAATQLKFVIHLSRKL